MEGLMVCFLIIQHISFMIITLCFNGKQNLLLAEKK
jgi:hypothetical protein